MDKYSFLLLTLVFANYLVAQNDYRAGFVITSAQDTLHGQVSYRSNFKNYHSCFFKQQHKVTEYTAEEIEGFGYDGGKYFVSGIVADDFVEVLVHGTISLYKTRGWYMVKKNGKLYELANKMVAAERNGRKGYGVSQRWRGTLVFLMQNCQKGLKDGISKAKLSAKSLTEIVVAYHDCTGESYTEFGSEQKWIQFDLGASISAVRSTLAVEDQNDLFYYLADTYTAIDWSPGMMVAVSAPRISDRLSAQAELQFLRTIYSSLIVFEQNGTDYYDVYIETNTLSTPVAITYFLPKSTYNPFVQAGLDVNINLKTNSRFFGERVIDREVITFQEREAFLIRPTQVGYFGSVGVQRSFDQFGSRLSLRYGRLSRLNDNGGFLVSPSYFSLQLVLFKR
ncbi:MAG: hypothetical protein AAGI23_00685 [Bacteroidota bacterium]